MLARLRMLGVGVALVGASCVIGCGGSAAPSGIGRSHAPRERGGIDVSLATPDGQVIEVADQHGAPVLLFLFATYDGASLATARGLARFTRDAPETVVIAVALQPDAETFAAAFVESQSPPYTVAYDAENRILRGLSDLGAIDAIPTLVMIDAHGREVARHTGYVSERMLQRWREEALGRGGVTQPPPAPEAEAEAGPEPEDATPEPESEPEGDVIIIEPDDP